jgi:hypothetical protein
MAARCSSAKWRAGRGWPTILVLALVYAVFEEAFTTETRFNPNYLGLQLRLLEPAQIPALGLGGWWRVFGLSLHRVWSISVSIARAEALVPDRGSTPWLGRPGLTSALFAFGAAASTLLNLRGELSRRDPAVRRGRAGMRGFDGRRLPPAESVVCAPGDGFPGPWLLGAGALAAGSRFLPIPQPWGWGAGEPGRNR